MKPILQENTVRSDPRAWLHLELEQREMLVLADARGQTLECRSGELWLTQEGAAEDRILQAGQSLAIGGDGSLVISACRDSRFVLGGGETPARVSLQRVRGFLAALLPREMAGLRGGWAA